MILRIILVFVMLALVDLYFYQAVKTLIADFSDGKKQIVKIIYWSISSFTALVGIIAIIIPFPEWNRYLRNYVGAVVFVLLITKFLGAVFLVIEDIIRLVRWLIGKFNTSTETNHSYKISRLKFFSYLALGFSAVPFVSLLYGIFKGAYRFKIHKVKISSAKIPQSFNGLKIVQISDLHVGSFVNSEPLETAFKMIQNLNPDIIFFTGDLVNTQTNEVDGFTETFKKLKAPMGVFSITGNHDYGDYRQWNNAEDKTNNFNELKKTHFDAGWRLLLNEHVYIEKGDDKLALIGVENWGSKMNFPKYGKLDKALDGIDSSVYKILLSHDPSHWDNVISKQHPDIDLTLSGHTHGMQFGIEIPGLKWSPSKYVYPHWAGLYKNGQQHLYVNRGLGFIGYPGRVGIWPEITLIELKSSA